MSLTPITHRFSTARLACALECRRRWMPFMPLHRIARPRAGTRPTPRATTRATLGRGSRRAPMSLTLAVGRLRCALERPRATRAVRSSARRRVARPARMGQCTAVGPTMSVGSSSRGMAISRATAGCQGAVKAAWHAERGAPNDGIVSGSATSRAGRIDARAGYLPLRLHDSVAAARVRLA